MANPLSTLSLRFLSCFRTPHLRFLARSNAWVLTPGEINGDTRARTLLVGRPVLHLLAQEGEGDCFRFEVAFISFVCFRGWCSCCLHYNGEILIFFFVGPECGRTSAEF